MRSARKSYKKRKVPSAVSQTATSSSFKHVFSDGSWIILPCPSDEWTTLIQRLEEGKAGTGQTKRRKE
jgi:hypothetical protein